MEGAGQAPWQICLHFSYDKVSHFRRFYSLIPIQFVTEPELLRRDALAQIEKYHELLRINEERQRQIDTLKAEVFRKTVEMRKLQSRLEELQGNGERPKTVDKPQITSENSSLPPSKDPIGWFSLRNDL